QLWGNEIPLCFLFMSGALYFHEVRKPVWSSLLLSLYSLTRMEGILLLGIMTLLWFYQRRRVVYSALVPPLLILGSWFLFSRLYFGDILPNTLYAKARQGHVGIWAPFGVYFLRTLRMIFLNPEWSFLSLCAWLGLTALARRRHALLVGWCALHQLCYWIIGVPGNYEWYFYPLWYLSPILIAGGVDFLAGARGSFEIPDIRFRLAWAALIGYCLFAGFQQPEVNTLFHARHVQYRQAAALVRNMIPPGSSVLADEIGILGFYLSDYIILDTAGLIHNNLPQSSYYRHDHLVQRDRPPVIIQCRYLRGDEDHSMWDRPLEFNFPNGESITYQPRHILPGEKIVVRILNLLDLNGPPDQ
ncbi:MAG TPA: hypothetical protein PLB62_06570, partial [Candidatus Sumerlaeota bacterium]|nr:hypothetical protein [Candidatus Sumerlaeota bacterium]